MKKIVILGCENSHADAFLKLITTKEEYSDVQVLGVYSNEPEPASKLKEKYNVKVMDNFDEAVGQVDGVVITARHGLNHLKYALPYIKSGVPMFIDKPVTTLNSDAVKMMQLMKESGVKVSGGSSLQCDSLIQQLKAEAINEIGGKTIGGYVRAPFQSVNNYGNFSFYAPHLVEMVCSIFGRYPISVTSRQNGGQIHVLFHYAEFDCVGLLCDNNYQYYACRMAEKSSRGFEIPSNSDWFNKEFKTYHDMLNGSAQPMSYEDFIAPVFVMNAIEESLNEHKEICVPKIEL